MSEAAPGLSSLRQPLHCLALGLGSGLLPKAPGTWGSLLALPLYFLLFKPLTPALALILLLLSFAFGVYCCQVCADALGVHDHPAIVWDEFVGQWAVLCYLQFSMGQLSLVTVVLAFLLFRLFDVFKPWPIRFIDSRIHGGFGIMADDVLAAGFAILLLWALQLSPVSQVLGL